MNLEDTLMQLCLKHDLTLGLAESCTGGAFAARITQLPGASHYFAGSIVSYQNAIKIKVLGVPEALLQNQGSVSEAVAQEMLKGALRVLGTDLALAITGVAGPEGGTPKTPLGTIYIACGGKKVSTEVKHFQLQGSRAVIIQEAIDKGLEQLIKLI